MIEVGEIVKIDKKNRATVRFPRREACEHCNACVKHKNEPYVDIVIDNVLNAEQGDRVEVTMAGNVVVTASLIAYLIPVVLVAIALGLTYRYNVYMAFGISMGALILSEIIIALIDRKLRKRTEYMPKMTAIITKKENENE